MPEKQPMPSFPSLSKTSLGALNDCERKWALNYQKGKVPVVIRPDIALESKLMPAAALAGQVVDDTITGALRTYHRKGHWPKKKPLEEAAREFLQQYLDASAHWIMLRKKRLPPDEQRRQPIDRLYYGQPYTSADKEELLAKIDSCLANFENSEIPDWITGFDTGWWKVPEVGFTPWFDWEGIPVWAKYDFAIVTPEKTHIVDWKTGEAKKEAEAGATQQLHIYGKYAMSAWRVARDQINLRSVWLSARPENCIHDQPLDVDVLAGLYIDFKRKHEDLKQRLKRVGRDGEGLFEQFPMTGFPRRCKWCNFHSCQGWVDSQGYKRGE